MMTTLKKTIALLALLMALATPAFAKDVYITSARASSGPVEIYGVDDTIGVNGNIYAMWTKLVYSDGHTRERFIRFVKEQDGWKAWYGNTYHGYIVDWPQYIEAIFDWLMDQTLR